MSNTSPAPAAALLQMINGFRVSQMICVATNLGLADLVADGPKSSAELAECTGVHTSSLYRLLRALSSLGIFVEDGQGRFGLTRLAEPLRSDAPDSVRANALFAGELSHRDAWAALEYSVATGQPAFDHVFGTSNWEYRATRPQANAIFNAVMTSNSRRDIPGLVAAYGFSAFNTVVDVGGGQGALIAAILRTKATMRGILFDQPHVVADAIPVLAAAGVADRCEIVSGSFFETLPAGADAYVLRHIIHDWDDEECVAILGRCHSAMPDHGKLLIIDGVIQPANRPDPAKLSDINMLVMQSGRERTESEFKALLARAGFTLTTVYATAGPNSIIEGVRA
jgi:hypothetical protein